jgi:hypothetical protein
MRLIVWPVNLLIFNVGCTNTVAPPSDASSLDVSSLKTPDGPLAANLAPLGMGVNAVIGIAPNTDLVKDS